MQNMISLPDVDTLMAGGLRDWLDAKAAERLEAKKQMYTAGGAGIGVGFAIALLAFTFGFGGFGYFFAAIAAGIGLAWAASIRQKMVNQLKQEMNGALAYAMGVEYSVETTPSTEFATAGEFDLLPSYDDDSFQDNWQGEVGGSQFRLYEAKLTEERGSGKNRHTVTVFQGIIIRLQFARAFTGTTLLRREGFKFTLFGDSKTYGGQKLERIKMVDPAFEDAFDVYGSDQVEARYLVHPAYCERLLELEREFHGAKLSALFFGGDVIVTIHADDMFESATLNPDEDREQLGMTIGQFGSLVRLITLLNERPRG
jgi:Protein of unknown function (DUF3137)